MPCMEGGCRQCPTWRMLVTTAFVPLSVLTVLKAASLPPKPKQAPAGRFIHSGACRRGEGTAAVQPHTVSRSLTISNSTVDKRGRAGLHCCPGIVAMQVSFSIPDTWVTSAFTSGTLGWQVSSEEVARGCESDQDPGLYLQGRLLPQGQLAQ